ncbi:MAG: hypothetical protein JWQ40_5089 [Segetibacter sp.]|jgi:hypothetical protein|nr:hypothetical protein [Segetibacter sp.]
MNTIVLKDTGQTLYYHKQKADIQNVLGKVSARLTEYLIYTDKDDNVCRLYKTREGCWYETL